jgi:hypothetical protein
VPLLAVLQLLAAAVLQALLTSVHCCSCCHQVYQRLGAECQGTAAAVSSVACADYRLRCSDLSLT